MPPVSTSPPVVTSTAQVRVRPSRLPLVVLAVLALGGIGAALFLYLDQRGAKKDTGAVATTEPIAMAVTSIDAAVAAVSPPPPPPAPSPQQPAAVDAGVPDAALSATATHPDTRPPPKKDPPRQPPPSGTSSAAPSGPPGYITIDSSPVYAVIFIDGKRYGETPLVQLALPPGKHGVRAVSPSGASRAMTIVIEPGKVAPTRRIEW